MRAEEREEMERNWQIIKETNRKEGCLIGGILNELNGHVGWGREKCAWMSKEKERQVTGV